MMNLSAGQTVVDPETGEQAFAIEPITNCPHALELKLKATEDLVKSEGQSLFWSKCVDCGNVGENWICLECNQIFCSRYVKGHMAEHNDKNSDHHVALSFCDLSFWCYSCDSYIINSQLSTLRKLFQRAKFNEGEFSGLDSQKSQNSSERQNDPEVHKKLVSGNGFFVAGDAASNHAYDTLIVKQFGKEISIEKGVLKGYSTYTKKNSTVSSFNKNDGQEAIGSVLRYKKGIENIVREKIIFLVNEIEGYPKNSSVEFVSVTVGEEELELAIHMTD